MFCLALVSGLEYDTKNEEDLKDYLKGLELGVRTRLGGGCSERKMRVNKKDFTILLNEADCSEDMDRGKICIYWYEELHFT